VKIKRIKSIVINCRPFCIKWDKTHNGGCFDFYDNSIEIGVKTNTEIEVLAVLSHELMEICACEMHVRLSRPDCSSDYIFVYDHRQFTTMMNMYSSALHQFIS
jgi:hypothetical protein